MRIYGKFLVNHLKVVKTKQRLRIQIKVCKVRGGGNREAVGVRPGIKNRITEEQNGLAKIVYGETQMQMNG